MSKVPSFFTALLSVDFIVPPVIFAVPPVIFAVPPALFQIPIVSFPSIAPPSIFIIALS